MQVEERLNVLAGFPRQVFADLNHDPLADAEDALDNLVWEQLVSGFTLTQWGSLTLPAIGYS